MTREEAIAFFKDMNECTYGKLEAVEMAIKALKQESSEDVISREPFTDSTICEGFPCDECSFNRKDKGSCILKERVMNLSSAKPQEPKEGHWIKYDKEYFTAEKLTPVIHSIRECSECHTRIADFCGEMKYCPNCGAKMESEE